MRVGLALLRKPGRMYPPPLPSEVPFMEMFPLQLQNKVSGKGSKIADVSCLQEMAVMFACMKKSEFKEVQCSSEIETFLSCYNNHTAEKAIQKKREASGDIVTGKNARKLTTKQLNTLLKKHPQFNEKI